MILLEVADKPLNIDKITYLDFMSVYAKEFGLSDKNLNGENHYITEFADIVRNYRYIAMENINSKNMMARPKGKPNPNLSTFIPNARAAIK